MKRDATGSEAIEALRVELANALADRDLARAVLAIYGFRRDPVRGIGDDIYVCKECGATADHPEEMPQQHSAACSIGRALGTSSR